MAWRDWYSDWEKEQEEKEEERWEKEEAERKQKEEEFRKQEAEKRRQQEEKDKKLIDEFKKSDVAILKTEEPYKFYEDENGQFSIFPIIEKPSKKKRKSNSQINKADEKSFEENIENK